MSRSSGIQDQYAQPAELQEAEGKVTLETSDLMQAIRVPYVLHPRFPQALSALKNNLDKLQLPENTSAQFFEELAREDHCICGRDMTDIARDEIAKRAKQYLGTEEGPRYQCT